MRAHFLLFAFVFVCCLSIAPSADAGTFGGTVSDEVGTPLGGAVVSLPGIAGADTTDASGQFMFNNVPAGSYVLTVVLPGSTFVPYRERIRVQEQTAMTMIVRLQQRVYTSDEIVIISTAPTTADRLESEPSQVDVVTRAEFEHTAATVEDVIASTPSAAITSYGGLGSFSEVSLRGSYSNQVQVYVDGMLLNEAVGGSVNLGLIPLTNVDRVEVWRSGTPARFGGDAVGGAINIITRDYRQEKGSASLGYGSFGTVKGHGIMGFGPPESRFLVSLDGAASRNDFEYTSDNGTPLNADDDYTTDRRNNEFRTLNGLAKYRRLIGTGMTFELSEHILHSRKNLPSAQHILDSSASLVTTKNMLQSRLTWAPSSMPWLETAPTVHSIVTREHYSDKDGQIGWGMEDNVYDTAAFKGMLPVSVSNGVFGGLTVTPMASRESYSPEHRLQPTVPLSSDREHFGVVTDLMLHTPEHLATVTATVRRDRYFSDYEGQANVLTPEPPPSQFHHFTNVQTGIKLQPYPLVSFRWNYGDNWRAPSFYELFGDRGGVVSSPGLKPEHVYKWDAGIRIDMPEIRALSGGRLDVVRFENTYRDLIQWYTNNYGFIEPSNVAGSYVRGTEIIWNARFLKSFGIRGNWTFQRSKVTDTAKSYHLGKKLPNRPEQYGTCTVEYTFRRATLFWTIDHKDPYYLDRANQEHMKYPGRTLHDMGFSFSIQESPLSWQVLFQNMTDERTFDIQGMPKPGRSFMATVTYTH